MALTDQEKESIRYHLGYTNVQPAASIQFGIPRPQQTNWLVETAMGNILETSLFRIRKLLANLDQIECRLMDALTRMQADQLGEIKLRKEETTQLEGEYQRWGKRLADLLGVPLYPYSDRYQVNRVRTGNVPVV